MKARVRVRGRRRTEIAAQQVGTLETDAERDVRDGMVARSIGGGSHEHGNRVAASNIRGNESRDGDRAAKRGASGKEEGGRAEKLIRGAGEPSATALRSIE